MPIRERTDSTKRTAGARSIEQARACWVLEQHMDTIPVRLGENPDNGSNEQATLGDPLVTLLEACCGDAVIGAWYRKRETP